MDPELHARLLEAALNNGIALGTHIQQKEEVKLVYSKNFVKSGEFGKICKKIGRVPEEILLEFFRPTGPSDHNHTFIMSKDIEPKHFEFNVHKLKRNAGALNDCLTDLLEVWSKDSSGKLKTHHKINEKMVRGYLKVRTTEHPDYDRKFSHEDIRQAIINYQLWAKASKDNERVWFQLWDLSGFLRSNKAISEWCYDLKTMKDKVGNQYFDEEEQDEDETSDEEKKKITLFHLNELAKDLKTGREIPEEWKKFWEENKHLLDEES